LIISDLPQLKEKRMTEQDWVVVETVTGSLQAELLRGLLEAQEIEVILSQEGAGRAFGLEVGPMGEVQILVSKKDSERARAIIDNYFSAAFEAQEYSGDEVEASEEFSETEEPADDGQ
jgi:hypothetical protein